MRVSSQYHLYVNETSDGIHAPGLTVSVEPTDGVPAIVGVGPEMPELGGGLEVGVGLGVGVGLDVGVRVGVGVGVGVRVGVAVGVGAEVTFAVSALFFVTVVSPDLAPYTFT